jgi:hypothetical protein
VGRGKILVWATTLDSYWSDLALQPVFLPFVHQLGKYAGRYSDARASFTAGDVLDLSRHVEIAGRGSGEPVRGEAAGVVVESPSGVRTRLASAAEGLIPLHEQGFYEIRSDGAAKGSGRRIAVNLDPAEANLARIDPQELKTAALAGGAGQGGQLGTVRADGLSKEDEERRQTIWWYLLVAAGLLLATETIISNRLSKPTA